MSKRDTRYLCLLLAIAVIRLWISPLGSSLWLDESVTFWVVKGGPSEIVSRSLFWMMSPIYSAIAWAAVEIGGPSEWVLRLPSVVAMGVAACLLYRIGARLFDREAGFLSAAVFVCMPKIVFFAADARPYAAAMLVTLGATLLLLRWLETGRWSDGIAYAGLAALTMYLHYLFATMLAIHAVYAVQHLRFGKIVRPANMLVVATLIALLLSPLAPYLSTLFQNRGVHAFAPLPGLTDLLKAIAPVPVLFALAVAGLSSRATGVRPLATTETVGVFLAAWIVLPALLLFVASRLTSASVFVERYYLPMMPGLALVAGWALRALEPAAARLRAVAVFVIVSVMALGGLRSVSTNHATENWRGAVAAANSVIEGTDTPLLFRSGLVEADQLDWLSDTNRGEALMSPLSMYRSAGRVFPLPFSLSTKSEEYTEAIASRVLDRGNKFVLLTGPSGAVFVGWLRGRFAKDGFSWRQIGDFGTVSVILFERKREPPPTVPSH